MIRPSEKFVGISTHMRTIIRFNPLFLQCSEWLSILHRIALLKAGSDTKLLKLAMSDRFILASAPFRHIDASLKVIGGAFTPTDGRTDRGVRTFARDIACKGTRQSHENKVELRTIKPHRPNTKRAGGRRRAMDDEAAADSTSIAERSNRMRLRSHELTPVSRYLIVCNVHTRLRSHRIAPR